jgi:hypothetical protein
MCAIPPTGAPPNLHEGWNCLLVASSGELRVERKCKSKHMVDTLNPQPA